MPLSETEQAELEDVSTAALMQVISAIVNKTDWHRDARTVRELLDLLLARPDLSEGAAELITDVEANYLRPSLIRSAA